MKTVKSKMHRVKLFVALLLSTHLFKVYAVDGFLEGYCYPRDVGQIFNGNFFSYSHMDLGGNPANKKIPTFWYKIKFKNLDNFEEQLKKEDTASINLFQDATINTTYGQADIATMYTKPNKILIIMGKDGNNNGSKWQVNISYNNIIITALVLYRATGTPDIQTGVRFTCNESTYNSKLKNFKFKTTDEFSFPVRLETGRENDNPLPIYTPGLVPNQGGFCRDNSKYPGFRLMWTYINGLATITIREPKDKNNFVLTDEEKESSWSTQRYISHTDPDYAPLNGLIDELYFANNNAELSVANKFIFYQKVEMLYKEKMPPVANDLRFTGDITKQYGYNTVSIEDLRQYLTTIWTLRYNGTDYNLNCTPTIELPWRAINTKAMVVPTTKDDLNIKYNSTPKKPPSEGTDKQDTNTGKIVAPSQ